MLSGPMLFEGPLLTTQEGSPPPTSAGARAALGEPAPPALAFRGRPRLPGFTRKWVSLK